MCTCGNVIIDKAGFHCSCEHPALLWAGFHAVPITVTSKRNVSALPVCHMLPANIQMSCEAHANTH